MRSIGEIWTARRLEKRDKKYCGSKRLHITNAAITDLVCHSYAYPRIVELLTSFERGYRSGYQVFKICSRSEPRT